MDSIAIAAPQPTRMRSWGGHARWIALAKPLAILWAVSIASNALTERLRLPIPGNAVTMLVMVALLRAGALRIEEVERAARPLVRHLTVFFAPIAAGIVGAWSAIAPEVGVLAVVLPLSVAAGIAATGLTAQALRARSAR
ncbi:MAG: hypothetical protein NVS3B7_02470 [Candidatus Elarobacter sp.]